MSRAVLRKTFKVAERIQCLLNEHGIHTAVIGGAACAAWKYPRHTRDLDLGCVAEVSALESLERALRAEGLEVELRLPDGEDPLGGMVVVQKKGMRRIEVINLVNPLRGRRRTPGAQAIKDAVDGMLTPSTLRVVRLEDLIALKLFAGGPASQLDILELVKRNPELDMELLAQHCARAGVGPEFERLRPLLSEV